MIALAGRKKMIVFGLLGTLGCIVAWGLGEGLLRASRTARGSDQPVAPSLVERPEIPDLPPPGVERPPAPAQPGKVPPPPPPAPPPPVMKERLERAGARTGDIQISLIWYNHNDLDLHCIDPDGREVWYKNKKVVSGGWLDVDRNATPLTTNSPVENIFWPAGEAPSGAYGVYVNFYRRRDSAINDSKYLIRVKVGRKTTLYEGSIRQGDPKRHICTFYNPPRTLRLGVPTEVVVHPGGKNRLGVKIVRDNFKDPVQVHFVTAAAGVSLSDTVIPADRDEAEVEIATQSGAPAGLIEVRVDATGGGEKTQATFPVRIRPIPPALQLAAPREATVNQGGENTLVLRVRRERFTGPVRIRFQGEVEGLNLDPTTLAEGRDEVTIPFTADRDAKAGPRRIQVIAAGPDARAEAALSVTIKEVVARSAAAWSWSELGRLAGWTGLLAVGLSLALVVGQNRYLGRGLLAPRQLGILGGSFLAGAIAGGFGQALFAGLALASLPPMLGFVVGWVLLGALLGRGVGYFIPNLHGGKAAAAGALGGLLGSLLFLLVVRTAGEATGRLAGAAMLGGSIGLMVALVEIAFRQAWLEVRYGPREVITVNLGPEPVKVGSDRSCTVRLRNVPAQAMRFWIREGKVLCMDVPAEQTSEAAVDRPVTLGSATLTVRTSTAAPAVPATVAATPAQPPPRPTAAAAPQTRPEPVPVVARPAAPPRPVAGPGPASGTGDPCPGCGLPAPRQPGRTCIVCGTRF